MNGIKAMNRLNDMNGRELKNLLTHSFHMLSVSSREASDLLKDT